MTNSSSQPKRRPRTIVPGRGRPGPSRLAGEHATAYLGGGHGHAGEHFLDDAQPASTPRCRRRRSGSGGGRAPARPGP